LSFVNKIVDTHIWIALAGLSFFISGFVLLNGEIANIPFYYYSLIFLATLFAYRLSTGPASLVSLPYPIIFKLTSKEGKETIGLILLLVLHIFFLGIEEIIFFGFLGTLTILYNLPERIRHFRQLNLRSIPYLKIFIISFIWASISSLLPSYLLFDQFLNRNSLLLFFGHFTFIFSITLPFDIRDYHRDTNSELRTIPGQIGLLATKIFSSILLLVSLAILFSFIQNVLLLTYFALIVLFLIFNSKPGRPRLYYTLWIDGTVILYFGIILMSRK
jgi:hypothetical protein